MGGTHRTPQSGRDDPLANPHHGHLLGRRTHHRRRRHIALPAGLIAQDFLVRDLAASVAMVLPASFVHVLGATDLLPLALAGLGIAILGALGPAAWAATSKTTTALRAE
jgi:hypothetical protein